MSRNNDVDGYWGIGKLCLLAQKSETAIVRINLLVGAISPDSQEFVKLIVGYYSFLQKHLTARNIPIGWITSVKIELDFNPVDRPKKRISILSRGNLFKLLVVITDDRNKMHVVSGYGRCRLHNPKREQKSGGTDRMFMTFGTTFKPTLAFATKPETCHPLLRQNP